MTSGTAVVVGEDSAFPRAHAGLSASATLLTLYNRDEVGDTLLRLGLLAAQRAVAADSTLGEAHAALGQALTYLGRRREAERAYRRAVFLEPGNATAHQWLAELLLAEGRVDESMAEMQLSVESDPFSGINYAVAANHFRNGGRFADAVRYGRRGVELNPSIPAIWEFYGRALYSAGLGDSAEGVFARHAPRHPMYAYIRARNGDPVVLDSVRRAAAFGRTPGVAPDGTVPPNALISLAADDATAALNALERAVARNPAFPLHNPLVDHVYDPLRDSVRFLALVRKAGLDERLNVRPRRYR